MLLIGIFKCLFIKNTQNQTNKGHVQLASLEKYLDFENVQSENPQYNNEKWVLSFQKSNVDLLFLTKCIGIILEDESKSTLLCTLILYK